jgi:hypothetical protein
MVKTLDAPRPNRTRRRPKTPTIALARDNTTTRKADGDALTIILAVIEELKVSNQEVKVELAEVKAQLAETKT